MHIHVASLLCDCLLPSQRSDYQKVSTQENIFLTIYQEILCCPLWIIVLWHFGAGNGETLKWFVPNFFSDSQTTYIVIFWPLWPIFEGSTQNPLCGSYHLFRWFPWPLHFYLEKDLWIQDHCLLFVHLSGLLSTGQKFAWITEILPRCYMGPLPKGGCKGEHWGNEPPIHLTSAWPTVVALVSVLVIEPPYKFSEVEKRVSLLKKLKILK